VRPAPWCGCLVRFGAISEIGEGVTLNAVEAGEGDVADGGGDLPGEIKLARFAKGHGLAGIEKNATGSSPLLLVEFEETAAPAGRRDSSPNSESRRHERSCGNRQTRPTAPRARLRRSPLAETFGATGSEQLELLEAAQQFGRQEGLRHGWLRIVRSAPLFGSGFPVPVRVTNAHRRGIFWARPENLSDNVVGRGWPRLQLGIG